MRVINLTDEEYLVLFDVLTDENLEKIVEIFGGDRNKMMILARIVCDMEAKMENIFDKNYNKIITDATKKMIQEFGNMNDI